jgi:CO dehydrogenase nickel-insertion accessory protein CooC1
VVSDATVVGLKAAKRITALVRELKIKTKKEFLVINRFEKKIGKELIKDLSLSYLGEIPPDSAIERLSLNGGSVMGLKKDSLSLKTLEKLGEPIWRKV